MQPDDALNDAAFDRELEGLMSADPSPEFVARVRTRIASESAAPAWGRSKADGAFALWRPSWMFAIGGAVAAIVVAALIVPRINRSAPAGTSPLASRQVAVPAAEGLPWVSARGLDRDVPPAVTAPSTSARAPGTRAIGPVAAAVAQQPGPTDMASGILIDARESAAIRRLIDGVRSGTLDLAPVLNASTPTAMELPPVDDLVIPPIAIEPLAPPAGAEGVRQ